jgi:hypothetical protein
MTDRATSRPDEPAVDATPDAEAQPRPRRHRRVVRQGAEREPVLGLPADERGSHGENDERLLRDVPPHWGRR